MNEAVYDAIEALLKEHVRVWKNVKSQEDGLGFVMAQITEFIDDPDQAADYAYDTGEEH